MKYLFLAICFAAAACTVKTQAPPVQIAVPQCPECEVCPECDAVELGSCYHMLGLSVFFPVYDDETGEIKEVIPVPSIEPGCYCRMMVNDFPVLTVLPVPDTFCEGDDDGTAEPELDGSESPGATD